MARIKDAAMFANGELIDVVEIRERPVRKSFFDDECVDTRCGKRNNKRRSFYRPANYRGKTKVQIFLLDMPRRVMIPLRSSF